jgi:hypothetical protein
MVDKFVTQ